MDDELPNLSLPWAKGLVEGEQTVVVSLTDTSAYDLGTVHGGTVTIADAALSTVTIEATVPVVSEPDSPQGPGPISVFTGTRSG